MIPRMLAQIDLVEGPFTSSTLPALEFVGLVVMIATVLCASCAILVDLWLFYGTKGRRLIYSIEARREAQNLADERNPAGAAVVLEDAGQRDAAANLWIEARDFTKASKLLIRAGFFERAVFEMSENNQGFAAAKLYEKSDRRIDAAYEYERASRYDFAARMFLTEDRFFDAARCFRKDRKYLDAAHNYERESALLEAAHCLLEHAQLLEFLGQESPDYLEEQHRIKLRAAKLLNQCKSYDQAAQVYEEEGAFEEAAENYVAAQRLQQASVCYRKAGKLRIAADLQEQIGDQVKALITRAEAAVADGDFLQAAKLFSAAEQPQRAAEFFEQAQAWEEAAIHHQRAGDLDLAQNAYAKLGDYTRAGRIAEKRQDFAAAAHFYQEAGDLDAQVRIYKLQGNLSASAKILLEMRRLEEADQVINTMDANDPSAIQTLEKLGDILRERGRLEDAYSRYRAAVGNRGVDEDTAHLYKKMAEVLAESNEFASAQAMIEKILLFKPDDSASIELLSRIDTLRARRKEQSVLSKAAESGRDGSSARANIKGLFAAQSDNDSRYEIIDEIARGGMGVVYRAKDRFLDRVVALKLLNETFAENEVAIQYFVREARAAAALNHPGIVTIFDVGQQQGQVFMAMELIDGTTLKHYVRHKGVLSESQIIWIIMQCCTALDYAHSKGIIHRDIKSGNVMLTRDKSLKIMDFGLAKAIQNHQGNHTQLIGTPYYMSPEQVSGVNVDFRSDLYSLGCMIYECGTGRVPFKEGEPAYHHVHTPPVPPVELNPNLSPALNAFILRLLEKLPENRFQSAADCLEFVKTM